MTGIFHITAIYWKSLEIGVQAALVGDDYYMVKDLQFTIHNDNGQINPNFYPGLNSLYLTCPSIENGIVRKGFSYEIMVHFVSSDNATFVFDPKKYSMNISGALQKLTMDYSKSDPFFIFAVPSVCTLTEPLRIVASIAPINTTNFANTSPLIVTIE
jgi:hypothetical protein